MEGAAKRILGHFAALLPPGLVLLLLGIQVAFGLRGFDRPDESLLYVLQVPGILLGWGGVALLLPLLTWMFMDWWGYDLNGFALKGLGSSVLGIAVGALVAISGGAAAGGVVGAGLANVLVPTLGGAAAVFLLIVMAGPAGVLAFSVQQRTVRPEKPQTAADDEGTKRGPRWRLPLPSFGFLRGRRSTAHLEGTEGRAWYPERRYDADGNEIPVSFGRSRDADGIRFVDEPASDGAPPESAADPAPPGDVLEHEERLPTIPELLSGQFDRSRLALDEADPVAGAGDGEPIHVDGEGRPLPPAPIKKVSEPAAPALAASRPLAFVPLGGARQDEEALAPGVRYADEPAETPDEAPAEEADEESPAEEEQQGALALVGATLDATHENGQPSGKVDGVIRSAPEASRRLSTSVEDAVRGPARVAHPAPAAVRIDSLRETLKASFQSNASSDLYLAKLEAIGMFDDIGGVPRPRPQASAPVVRTPIAGAAPAPAAPPARAPKPRAAAPRKRTAKKKPAVKKAKKRTAKRKAPATKRAARKKAAKKKAAGRKKAAARKKAPARRRAVPKKRAAAKKKAAARKKAPAKKRAAPRKRAAKKKTAARKKAPAKKKRAAKKKAPAKKKAATKPAARKRAAKKKKAATGNRKPAAWARKKVARRRPR